MKAEFVIPQAEVESMENSLMRLLGNGGDHEFRARLPENAWPLAGTAIIDGQFSRPKPFWRSEKKRIQKARALTWLLKQRGLA